VLVFQELFEKENLSFYQNGLFFTGKKLIDNIDSTLFLTGISISFSNFKVFVIYITYYQLWFSMQILLTMVLNPILEAFFSRYYFSFRMGLF